MLIVKDLKCDFKTVPTDIGSDSPLLSWRLSSDRADEIQTALQVQVCSSEDFDEGSLLWDTGRIESHRQQLCYDGQKPCADDLVYWRVRVWNEKSEVSA